MATESRISGKLVAHVGELLLRLVGGVFADVARLGEVTLATVVLGVRLGVLHHLVDLLLREA